MDQIRPGYVIFTDWCALMTSDGTTHVLAGNSYQQGYKGGIGGEARFDKITEFAQISKKRVVLADYHNDCLRLIARTSYSTSAFSGWCQSVRYRHWFRNPWSELLDKKDKIQLLVADNKKRSCENCGCDVTSCWHVCEICLTHIHQTKDTGWEELWLVCQCLSCQIQNQIHTENCVTDIRRSWS